MDDYENKEKHEKGQMAASVVRQIKSESGRFLSKDSGVWMEVKDEVVITKTSQLFFARREVLKFEKKNRATIPAPFPLTSRHPRATSPAETISTTSWTACLLMSPWVKFS
jgi:hypothetical protein